jgi:phosphate/sulfate permease
LIYIGLPAIPLVPVSSSQAIVGAILGVGLLKQAREIKFNVIGGIATGWITTPILAGLISFFMLFFVSNVFNLEVAKPNSLIQNVNSSSEIAVASQTDTANTIYNYDDSTKLIMNKQRRQDNKVDSQGSDIDFMHGNVISQDSDSVSFAKQFLIMLIGIIILIVIGAIFYYYKRKAKENIELTEKSEQIEESQKAYMESELENTKILNESLETELEFQRRELTNLALNLIKKNEFLDDIQILVKEIKSSNDIQEKEKSINTLLSQINQSMNIDKERKTFYLHIEETNNDFFLKLEQSFPTLTLKEKQLAALLRLNLSSKDIAHLQNISPKSVEMNRYRLRQKMNIEAGDSLTEFINKI